MEEKVVATVAENPSNIRPPRPDFTTGYDFREIPRIPDLDDVETEQRSCNSDAKYVMLTVTQEKGLMTHSEQTRVIQS